MPTDLPVSQNPLRTRADVERALIGLLEPVMVHFTDGDAGLRLGDFAAHYGGDAARVEAFSRMLWGLAPLWAHSGETRFFERFRRGLIHGTDPAHPAYWGEVGDCDQKIVEMASIALTLMLDGERLALDERESANLHAWLGQINARRVPLNNWLFFRVLVNAAFCRMGWAWDRERVEEDFRLLDGYYLGGGWYCDGQPTQLDYYIPFGMHFYGLVYARFMGEEDPERCRILRERGRAFAEDFLYWFEPGGAAVPFGRSLTYRFGQGAFFSALALAGVEAVDWGVMKSRVLANLRWWLAQPVLSGDGLLTVGYAYPNLCMSENYNAPGSPYWGLKTFLCLAFPEDHPFWKSEEKVPELKSRRLIPQARMLLCRDEKQVQMFPAGQHCVNQLGNCAAKYEKLCYSTRFGFSVSRGDSLEEGAFDNCMAFSEAGEERWRMGRGFISFEVSGTAARRTYFPMRGVSVTVAVTPDFPSHRREYTITTDRPIDAADGGFAIPAERDGVPFADDMVEWSEHGVAARFPWGVSAIRSVEGGGEPLLVKAFPNTNVLSPLTRIPTLRFRLGAGTHRIVTVVTGDV